MGTMRKLERTRGLDKVEAGLNDLWILVIDILAWYREIVAMLSNDEGYSGTPGYQLQSHLSKKLHNLCSNFWRTIKHYLSQIANFAGIQICGG